MRFKFGPFILSTCFVIPFATVILEQACVEDNGEDYVNYIGCNIL